MPVNSVNTAFQGVLSNDTRAFCLPRQDLPGMMKSLISSHKPRFLAFFVLQSQIYQRFTNISGEPDLQKNEPE